MLDYSMLSRVVAPKAFKVTARRALPLILLRESGEVLEDVGQVCNLPF